ncbi:hypothetical protein BDC45DRAFT_508509 [Circinella umbellata]|nr:hypothetical protein BDC45DRAFT_508509 [Circinella umbellata]
MINSYFFFFCGRLKSLFLFNSYFYYSENAKYCHFAKIKCPLVKSKCHFAKIK